MKIFIGILLAVGLIGIGWMWTRPVINPSEPLVPDDPTSAMIVFPSGQTFWAEVADTAMERNHGLSRRAEPQAMLFLFDAPAIQTFWMYEMAFPIDLLWLDQGVIVGMEQEMLPESPATTLYTSPIPVQTVLELPVGTIANEKLTTGQRLDIQLNSK